MAKNSYYGRVDIRKEAFNTLRTNIQFSSIDEKLQTVAVTSSYSAEGKTTVTVSLAEAFALTGIKVLVLNCDMRKSSMQEFLDEQVTTGLTNVLMKQKSIDDVIVSQDGVDFMLTGPIPPNPSELLGSQAMKSLVENLRSRYDLILIDTPPIGLFSDAIILSPVVDAYMMICAEDSTKKEELSSALAQLDHVDANVLGIVMTMVKGRKDGTYGKYGQYGKYGN